MKHNIAKLVGVGALLMATASCSDSFFEYTNQNAVDISTMRGSFKDLDVAINGAYGGFEGPACYGQYILFETLGTDLVASTKNVSQATANFQGLGREMSWFKHVPNNIDDASFNTMQWGSWSTNMSNVVTETIEKEMIPVKSPVDQQNRDRLLGEGYLMRGIMEFLIVKALGKQYHSSTLDAPAGVYRTWPIIGTSDIPKKRETVKSTYDKLIADFKNAEALLPDQYKDNVHAPAYEYRCKKDVATGMLARLYFQKNDFDSALIVCNRLLGNEQGISPKFPLEKSEDYAKKLFQQLGKINFAAGKGYETIMAFEGTNAQKPTRIDKWQQYLWTGFTCLNGAEHSSARYGIVFGPSLVDYFLECDTAKDIRYKQTVYLTNEKTNPKGQATDKSVQWTSLKATYPNSQLIFMRAAEFHLMRAECYLHKNQLDKAISEINLIRERARIDLLPANSTKEIVMKDIIRQRAVELYFEDVHRWNNLRLASLEGTQYAAYLPEPYKSGLVPLGDRDPIRDRVYTDGKEVMKWNDDRLYSRLGQSEFLYNPGL